MVIWERQGFFVEIKSGGDCASVFIDCPLQPHQSSCTEDECVGGSEAECKTVILNGCCIAIRRRTKSNEERSQSCYYAYLNNISFLPHTMSAATYADNQRVFMCKIRVSHKIELKPYFRLIRDLSHSKNLMNSVDEIKDPLYLVCLRCRNRICDISQRSMTLEFVDDDWFNVAPNFEYFCRCSCSRGDSDHGLKSLQAVSDFHAQHPSLNRLFISDLFIFASDKSTSENAVIANASNVLECTMCQAQLGSIMKGSNDVYQFHHSVVSLTSDQSTYIRARFECLEYFFAYMVLKYVETEYSSKIVFRSLDKKSKVLIWLLDSYVVAGTGVLKLQEVNLNDDDDIKKASHSIEEALSLFPALKILYKIFDDVDVLKEPRANGKDTSIGVIDLPLECCLKLIEMLLQSSLTLPPTSRAIGRFLVGILKLGDSYVKE